MQAVVVIIPSIILFVAALVLAGVVLWTRAMIALEINLRPVCPVDVPLRDPSSVREPSCALAQLALYSRCAVTNAYGPSTQEVRWVGESYAAVCVRFRSGAVAVAFRGTQTTEDAIVNMDTTLVQNPYRAGRVHRGFLEHYQELREELQQVLVGWGATPATVQVTGHSLGAALATLATFDWLPAHTRVFGSPKIGDETTAAELEAIGTFRAHVNLFDPVCTLPARGPYIAPVSTLVLFACDKGCWSENHSMSTYVDAVCNESCGCGRSVSFEASPPRPPMVGIEPTRDSPPQTIAC